MRFAGLIAGSLLIAAAAAPGPLVSAQPRAAAAPFTVEPLWPKPFPVGKKWILGSVSGVTVDAQDRIWVVHRGLDSLQANEKGPALEPWASMCCFAAPQVLAFNAAGDLVANWEPKETKGYDWPVNPAGIAVDAKGNVWIGSGLAASALPPAGRGRGAAPAAPAPPADGHVLKFDKTGKFVAQIGKPGQTDGANNANLDRPLAVAVDDASTELYVADDGHGRIAVFDANSGAFKREIKPDGAASFKTITCVKVAKDGLVYVCDRGNNRIQVFQKDGRPAKQQTLSPETKGDGSVWDIAFSPDQKQIYVADGHNKTVHVLDRAALTETGTIGSGGRYPGLFYGVGSVATDSKGNLYTGETYEGKRVQKFVKR